jgi:hypothetical protein
MPAASETRPQCHWEPGPSAPVTLPSWYTKDRAELQESLIAELAFEAWVRAGKPSGDVMQFWAWAEHQLAGGK